MGVLKLVLDFLTLEPSNFPMLKFNTTIYNMPKKGRQLSMFNELNLRKMCGHLCTGREILIQLKILFK